MNPVHAAATELASQGYCVFPLKPRDKVPATRNGLRDASNDAAQVDRWFAKSPGSNLAIRTGDRHWVLDVDGPAGEQSLATRVAEHGELPVTTEVRTGKGRQFYFTLPASAEIRNRASVLPGLDVRGVGGYVVAPPSIHPNGKPYLWTQPLSSLTAAPSWLVELVRSKPSEQPPATERNGSHEGNGYGNLIARGRQYAAAFPSAGEGTRNAQAFKLGGSLAALEGLHGERLSRAAVLDLAREWNRLNIPPLEDSELVKAVDSARTNGKPPAPKPPGSKPTKRLAPLPARRPFPVVALPSRLRDFVETTADAIGCPPEMVGLPALVACAGAIGASRVLRIGDAYSAPAILWGGVVAPSGTAKSPAFRQALAPLYATERRLARQFEHELQAWNNHEGERRPPKPVSQTVLVSDATVESLGLLFRDNPRGLLQSCDELSRLILSFDSYRGGRGGDSAAYLSMFDGSPVKVNRKSGDRPAIFIDRPALSIIGTIQPGIVERVFSAEHREAGLLARFLLTTPDPSASLWRDRCVPAEVRDGYARLIDDLQSLRMLTVDDESEPIEITLSDDAKACWTDWHNARAAGIDEASEPLRAALSKLRGYCPRLTLVVHCIRAALGEAVAEQTADVASVDAAITLTDWFEGESRRAYGMMGESEADRAHRRLATWIERQGGRVSVRDLQRLAPRQFRGTADECEAWLRAFVERGLGVWESCESPASGGHATRVVRLVQAGDSDARPESLGETDRVSPVASNEGP